MSFLSLFSSRTVSAEFLRTWPGQQRFSALPYFLKIVRDKNKAPSAVLLTYFGQVHLPKIIHALGEELSTDYQLRHKSLTDDAKILFTKNLAVIQTGRKDFSGIEECSWNRTQHALESRNDATDAYHALSLFLLTSGIHSELFPALGLKESPPLITATLAQGKEDEQAVNNLLKIFASRSLESYNSLNLEDKAKFQLALIRNIALIEHEDSSFSKPSTWLDLILEWRTTEPDLVQPLLNQFKLMHVVYTVDVISQRTLSTDLPNAARESFKNYLIYKTIHQFDSYCPLPDDIKEELYQLFNASDKDRRMACFYFFWLLQRIPDHNHQQLLSLTLKSELPPYKQALQFLKRFSPLTKTSSSPQLVAANENVLRTQQILRKMAFVAIFDFFTRYQLTLEDKAFLFRWIHEEPRLHLWVKYFDYPDQNHQVYIRNLFINAYRIFSQQHFSFQNQFSAFADLIYILYFLDLPTEEIEYLSFRLAHASTPEREEALREVQHYGISIGLSFMERKLPDSPYIHRMNHLNSDLQEYLQFNPRPVWQKEDQPYGYSSTIISFFQALENHSGCQIPLVKLIKTFCHPFFTLKRVELINRLKPQSDEDREILFDWLHEQPPLWLKHFDTLQHDNIQRLFFRAYQIFSSHFTLQQHLSVFSDLIYILYFLDLQDNEIRYLSSRLVHASSKERKAALKEIEHYGISLHLLLPAHPPSTEGGDALEVARQRRFSISAPVDQEKYKLPELPYTKRNEYLKNILEKYLERCPNSPWQEVLKNWDKHHFPTFDFIQAFEKCSKRELPLHLIIKMLCYPFFSNQSIENIGHLEELKTDILENATTFFVPEITRQTGELIQSFLDSDVVIQLPGTGSHAFTFIRATSDTSNYLQQAVLAPTPYAKMIRFSSLKLFSEKPELEYLQNLLSFYPGSSFNNLVYFINWKIETSPALGKGPLPVLEATFLFSLEQPKSVSIRVPLHLPIDVLRNEKDSYQLFFTLLKTFIHERMDKEIVYGSPEEKEFKFYLEQFPNLKPMWEHFSSNQTLMEYGLAFFKLIKDFKIQARGQIASLFTGKNLPRLASQTHDYIPLFDSNFSFMPSDWERLAEMMYSAEKDIELPSAFAFENSNGNIDVLGISFSSKEVETLGEKVAKNYYGNYLRVILWIPNKYSYTFHIQRDKKKDTSRTPIHEREDFIRIVYHVLCWQLLMIKNQLFPDQKIKIRANWEIISEHLKRPSSSSEGTVDRIGF